VLRNDSEAFNAIVQRYSNALMALAMSRIRNVEDSRDIVQEALVAAYCRIQTLESPEQLGAWLRGIVVNFCNKHVDRVERHNRFIQRLPHPSTSIDAHGNAVEKDRVGEIRKALDSLNETQREVTALFYFQNASVDEVSRLLNKPAGTVKRILSEVRSKLKEELIEMARSEFSEYQLTKEQRERLEKIPTFPHQEPKIVTVPTSEPAPPTRLVATYGNFPKLETSAEAFYADYDYPGRSLTSLSHTIVQGPFEVDGRPAYRYDDWSFTKEGRAEGIWQPYYALQEDEVLYCGKRYGETESSLELVTPSHKNWGEAQPISESLVLVPGAREEPNGERTGRLIDAHLWSVQIGRHRFLCLRRVTGGDVVSCDWADKPITQVATEEFVLPDGRLLLWRRYNGEYWSVKNPSMASSKGAFEKLEKAQTPILDAFGFGYRLWYDQIPSYAILGIDS
jgi:RNA polymerase sigma-70 factor (ECF subfamily)